MCNITCSLACRVTVYWPTHLIPTYRIIGRGRGEKQVYVSGDTWELKRAQSEGFTFISSLKWLPGCALANVNVSSAILTFFFLRNNWKLADKTQRPRDANNVMLLADKTLWEAERIMFARKWDSLLLFCTFFLHVFFFFKMICLHKILSKITFK